MPLRAIRVCFAVFILPALWAGLVIPGPAWAQDKDRIDYTVFFEGPEDEDLKNLLQEVSATVAGKDNPPLTEGLLKKRVQGDITQFEKALRSRGYYLSEIKTELNTEIKPARVVFRIETGPVYRLKNVAIQTAGPSPTKKPDLPGPEDLGLEQSLPADARPITEARSVILNSLRNQGFPLAAVKQPRVIVDHQDQTLSVTYIVEPGPPGVFGTTDIKGADSVDPSYIRALFPWQPGDIFQAELLEEARVNLLETGLFNLVRFETGNRLDPRGRLPLILQVTERQHRTLKLGLGYTTDEGVLGRADWEHRNIFHKGESLGFLAQASGIGLTLEGDFEKPAFLRPDQSLIFNLKLADEFPDAYSSRNITGLAQVKRELGRGLDLALGVALTFSEIEQFGEERTFELISLPAAFNWDRRDDILDPVRGGNLSFKLAPFYDFLGGETSFYKSTVLYSHYFRLISHPRTILALRGTAGFLGGSGLEDIPADLRFYAGGGGSIRGYAYQSVGPLFGDTLEPIGGRSLLTLSSEVRINITENIGLVPFIDGGNIFETEYPGFDRDLFWGAGLGLRYFTSIGPLRLDVAVPLNKRETDDAFQIYISLGQAF